MDRPAFGDSFAFSTSRLAVDEWHQVDVDGGLGPFVVSLLTPAVTRSLPPAWQGPYAFERAESWISERDRDGTTLIVVDRTSGRPIGLFILHLTKAGSGDDFDVRVGYLLAEHAWGRGYGGEMVAGFVARCRAHSRITSVLAGVEAVNLASIRILEHNGFERVSADDAASELEYRLVFEPRSGLNQ